MSGRRLYTHHQIDHPRLFQLLADTATDFMLTYDHAPEIAALVDRHHLHAVQVTMKNTHHNRVGELVITNGYTWPMTAERLGMPTQLTTNHVDSASGGTIRLGSKYAWIDGRG